jgi:small ubiquitin-related modifier
MDNNGQPPQEDKKSDHINIRVVSQDKGEVYFKIRKTTPLRKLMTAYCEKQGIALNSTRFMFDDKRLNPEHTAEQAHLENDDLIEAFHEQQGGSL